METIGSIIDFEQERSNLDVVPVLSRLIVKEKTVEMTKGGLYIPETAKKGEMQTNEGIVLAVGPDVTVCKPGDSIYYGRYSGSYFTRRGLEYRIMNDEDILGLVR